MVEADLRLAATIHVADLADRAERLMLANALEDAGRHREAMILRSECEARAYEGEVWRVSRVFEAGGAVLVDSPDEPACGPIDVQNLRNDTFFLANVEGGDRPEWCVYYDEEVNVLGTAVNYSIDQDDENPALLLLHGRLLREGERLVVIRAF